SQLFFYRPKPPKLGDSCDLFSCRAQLSGTNASTTVSIYGATGESGEPSHAIANFSLTNSVWLTWLAPFSGAATIRATCPTNGTTIHVYSGNAVTNLTEISGGLAEFTNSFGLYENLVTFSAGSNVTYQIAVDCNGGALPSHVVTLYLNLTNPPPNDHFTNATVIPGMFFQASGSFDGATMETGETNHEAYIYGPFGVQWPATDTLWWKWAAPTNLGVGIIPVNIMADAVSFPPMIRVYQGNSLSNLTSVFSTDSESGMTHSTEFLATAGETYYLAMAGLQNDPRYLNVSSRYGDFRLRLNARALVLNISSVNTFGFGPTVPFQAIVNVSNHGSATSDLLRLVVVARSGVGVRGVDYGYTVSDEQILFITNLSALIPDQNIDVAVDGVVPGPVGDVNCIPPDYCNYNGTNGIGYGVYAELQE
ncbi:MAG TPA: hypothetical protein PLU80_19435, partial [Acidobacteriota bacterium]|nr:hypothetical protein [Acidobacteriota bacterium]